MGKPRTTQEILEGIFEDLRSRQEHASVRKKVAFLSTPRSGSTFFCDTLARAGVAGDPKEWLNIRYLKAYARVLGLNEVNLDEYLSFVVRRTVTPNGVFSVNIHMEQLMGWREKGVDALGLGFDAMYRIYRRDRPAQALSLARAAITDQWSADASALRTVNAGELSNLDILNALTRIARQDAFYDEELAHRARAEVAYEDFSEDQSVFMSVLQDLGVQFEENELPRSALKRQSGDPERDRMAQLARYLGIQGETAIRASA